MSPSTVGKSPKREEFYNREEEIEMAVKFLRKLQCFSIIGENGMGRTSFLTHILSREILEKHGIDPERYVIVYLDISGLYEPTKDTFIKTIVENIEKQTGTKIESVDIFDKLKTLIENLASNDRDLIIALDEFERIAPFLDDQLSPWLRHIFQRRNVVAITASQKRIRELEKSGGSASPLYNIFSNLPLGLISRGETESIIYEIFQKEGIKLKKKEISFLSDLSGGNPHIIKLLILHYNQKMTKNEFKKKIFDQVKDLFEGYWEHLNEEEREFLFHMKSTKDDFTGYNLETRGFTIRKNAKYKIFSPLFEKFVNLKARRPKEKENLIFTLLSMMTSIFLLEILGKNVPTVQGFPEIPIGPLDRNIQITQIISFIALSIILFLLFKRIRKFLTSKKIKIFQILSKYRIFFSIFLILISFFICKTLGTMEIFWSFLGSALFGIIYYYRGCPRKRFGIQQMSFFLFCIWYISIER
ncbi:MAG: hypothetical protein HXS48_00845 [Theionarchaea archaeon]|nr:hypothetical protein [Theionarchaea archaeon]